MRAVQAGNLTGKRGSGKAGRTAQPISLFGGIVNLMSILNPLIDSDLLANLKALHVQTRIDDHKISNLNLKPHTNFCH